MEPKNLLIFIACCVPLMVAQSDMPVDTPGDTSPLTDPTCMIMLENFANLSSKYTYCSILHARPISVCRDCILDYLNVSYVYDDITKIDSKGGRKCGSELANLDRLEIFENGMKYIKDMWAKAFCDTCFVPDPIKGRPTSVQTRMVQEILNASLYYRACVDKYHNETSPKPDTLTCSLCASEYANLNYIYTSFKTETGVIEFCMDIVDLVNSTRNEWSDVVGCCKARRTPELSFIFSATGIAFLPVLFYLMTYAFTPKKEHDLIERRRPAFGSPVNGTGVVPDPNDTSS